MQETVGSTETEWKGGFVPNENLLIQLHVTARHLLIPRRPRNRVPLRCPFGHPSARPHVPHVEYSFEVPERAPLVEELCIVQSPKPWPYAIPIWFEFSAFPHLSAQTLPLRITNPPKQAHARERLRVVGFEYSRAAMATVRSVSWQVWL